MDEIVKVPYSADQADAHIDSCLYGLPYGFCLGEYDYIDNYLKAKGYDPKDFRHEKLDDINYTHIMRKVK